MSIIKTKLYLNLYPIITKIIIHSLNKMINATAPADQTETWYRQLETALQAQGITGLTEDIRLAMVKAEELLRAQPAPARLLHVLRERPEAFPLTAAGYGV